MLIGKRYKYYKIGEELFSHAVFLALFVISIVQYLERTLPFDGAYYCFKIVSSESFNIEGGRWGAIYNQIIPLLALKLNCSLKSFLIAYSFSFVFCNYIFFLVIRYYFKQLDTALVFILLLTVFYRYNFYYSVSEIHSVFGPLFLFLAFVRNVNAQTESKPTNYIFGLILIFWILNTHILSICLLSFILAYFFFNHQVRLRKLPIGLFVFSFVLFFIQVLNISKDSYQGEKIGSLSSITDLLLSPGKSEGLKYLSQELPNNYLPAIILLLVVFIYYLKNKSFVNLFLIMGAIGVFLILYMAVNVTYQSTITMSNYYPVFGFFILIPFVFGVYGNITWRFKVLVIIFLVSFSIFKILKCSVTITEEIDYHKRTIVNLRNYNASKFLILKESIDLDKIWMTWDMPFQSLIISSLDSVSGTITYFVPDSLHRVDDIKKYDEEVFLGVNFAPFQFKVSKIPTKYFNLRSDRYLLATTYRNSLTDTCLFSTNKLQLNFEMESLTLFQRMYRTIPVIVKNNSECVLSCLSTDNKSIKLYYEILNVDGSKILSGTSNLEVDIPSHKQIVSGIKIRTDGLRKGQYVLVTRFVRENVIFGDEKRMNLTLI